MLTTIVTYCLRNSSQRASVGSSSCKSKSTHSANIFGEAFKNKVKSRTHTHVTFKLDLINL